MDAFRGTETILVVEDNAAVRFLIQQVLTSCNYTVLVASDGAEAIRLASRPINLLVTDVVLPDISGRVLAERLDPGLRVLYISGHDEDALANYGLLPGQVPFLQKPFTLTALARKVREVLDTP